MASVTSVVKASEYILKSPFLSSIFVPLSKTFVNLSGYRQMGLRFDDLIAEESPIVQTALKRLDEKESYDRIYRILTASQLSLTAQILPKNEAVKAEDDKSYLIPYILEAEAAAFERSALDNITVVKK
ncbi:uncharacterized protein SAPINGB_P006463 [Magnusiomyces paraingens]|uniref:Cytochrome b-c1 complex subunit 7 n=1 Tax=Magnusiomyces paraingens TaxID=2606893 RepID=A0A5E8C7S4_9ASCO|nr:uncharacterized protein SAPINGB_P006463 [Saprochaete ingens]VVT58945.1 unnamed protein product [Saprochaete ingens]